MKHLLIFITLLIVFATPTRAHPDGAIPYWYPSSYIYGFIDGCATEIEVAQAPFTKDLWPENIRSICGCVVDALRHVLTFQQVNQTERAATQVIVDGTLPVCVEQEKRLTQP